MIMRTSLRMLLKDLKKLQDNNIDIILWSCRPREYLIKVGYKVYGIEINILMRILNI